MKYTLTQFQDQIYLNEGGDPQMECVSMAWSPYYNEFDDAFPAHVLEDERELSIFYANSFEQAIPKAIVILRMLS